MKLSSIPRDEVTFTIKTHACDMYDIEDHFDDESMVAAIKKDYESGNEWAWCEVEVIAEWNGFKSSSYLAGCSYNSEEDFKNDEYSDCCDSSMEKLQEEVEEKFQKLLPLIEVPTTLDWV